MIDNFIKMLSSITCKIPNQDKINGVRLVKLIGDNKISFSLQSTSEPTISEYPSLDVFLDMQFVSPSERNPNRRQHFQGLSRHNFSNSFKDTNVYILSYEDFNRFCKSKLNIIFAIRMNNLIELCEKEELHSTLHYLIPKYEISFNTILNVINEQLKNSNGEQFPESMVEKMFYIIDSFEKDLFEAEKDSETLKLLTAKAVEKNLEEQLEFEVEYINKVSVK